MALDEFRKSVVELRAALGNAKQKGIDLNRLPPKNKVYDFSSNKDAHYRNAVFTSLEQLRKRTAALAELSTLDPANPVIIDKIKHLVAELDFGAPSDNILAKILEVSSNITVPKVNSIKKPASLPAEIKDDVYADIDELSRAFTSGCYRSTAILCGRILEVALHRKYFEATGDDLLEKAPGIGLGKLVAKLSENSINIDPALTQQIHLINNVRVSSVHVKQDVFSPTKAQAEAMILYTLDILERIFENKA